MSRLQVHVLLFLKVLITTEITQEKRSWVQSEPHRPALVVYLVLKLVQDALSTEFCGHLVPVLSSLWERESWGWALAEACVKVSTASVVRTSGWPWHRQAQVGAPTRQPPIEQSTSAPICAHQSKSCLFFFKPPYS